MSPNPAPVKPGFEIRHHDIPAVNGQSYLTKLLRGTKAGGLSPGLHVVNVDTAMMDDLEERRFRLDRLRPKPVPVVLINGKPVSTAGNITTIIAQAKAGKTAYIAAILSAVICAEYGIEGRDNLCVTATAPEGKKVVHVDTEQSPPDHDEVMLGAMRRAGVDKDPTSIWSFTSAGKTPDEAIRLILAVINDARRDGGVHLVIIDGVADLVLDVNDASECNELVANLQKTAIKLNCPIICVLHENPGADTGKMRGHLGSQLERKAESNLRLRKTGDITVVFSEKMRRAPIFEKDGPRFTWSDAEQMHVSTGTAGEARNDAKRSELLELAGEAFETKPQLRFVELTDAIVKARDCTKRTAARKIEDMAKHKVITKQGFGLYSLTTDKSMTNAVT